MARIILQKPRRMWKNCFKRIYKKGAFQLLFYWAQSRQKFFLDNISHSPVWNFFGETEDFFLTFYAKK